MLGAKIVWITLMETRSVRRWAACELSSCILHSNARHAGILCSLTTTGVPCAIGLEPPAWVARCLCHCVHCTLLPKHLVIDGGSSSW
jgi:hypothetical protein